MHKVDVSSAEHYTWGEQCDGWHLLKHADLGVIEERMPPGAREQRHLHQRARQFFYVLEGNAMLELEGRRLELAAGQGAHIPAGAAHQMCNESDSDVRFLVVSTPHSHGDRVGQAAVNE